MQSPKEVAAGIRDILDLIKEHAPNAKVILHDVFPRGETPLDPSRLNNVAINDIIATYHDGKNVFYHPIGHVFLKDDETINPAIMPDALHLSEEGYKLWANALEPMLAELTGDK